MKILLIDNRDSFTHNLGEACERIGASIQVVRNDVPPQDAFDRATKLEAIILLSPGPGHPGDAGCCLELIKLAKAIVPLLGVCLGHQAMVLEAGGRVSSAGEIVHGKSSLIRHDELGPFAGLPNPMGVGRYHSLCTIDPPPNYHIHAQLNGMAMAISDANARQVGLQFHPESILTPHGDAILKASLAWLAALR